MEEEDKKVELDSDIWKKYEKKEAKNFNKILITIFLLAALVYIVKFLMGFFLYEKSINKKVRKRSFKATY